ncbi:hypothetical protein HY450_03455 [Candidatus Pacearchaeota archaeon]|nr:hypothetical protein [Candidatus Pacearchaeota archaeon]
MTNYSEPKDNLWNSANKIKDMKNEIRSTYLPSAFMLASEVLGIYSIIAGAIDLKEKWPLCVSGTAVYMVARVIGNKFNSERNKIRAEISQLESTLNARSKHLEREAYGE